MKEILNAIAEKEKKEKELLEEYDKEREDIEEMCIEEGYPGKGSNYELRCSQLWEEYYLPSLQYYYPEKWGNEEID